MLCFVLDQSCRGGKKRWTSEVDDKHCIILQRESETTTLVNLVSIVGHVGGHWLVLCVVLVFQWQLACASYSKHSCQLHWHMSHVSQLHWHMSHVSQLHWHMSHVMWSILGRDMLSSQIMIVVARTTSDKLSDVVGCCMQSPRVYATLSHNCRL